MNKLLKLSLLIAVMITLLTFSWNAEAQDEAFSRHYTYQVLINTNPECIAAINDEGVIMQFNVGRGDEIYATFNDVTYKFKPKPDATTQTGVADGVRYQAIECYDADKETVTIILAETGTVLLVSEAFTIVMTNSASEVKSLQDGYDLCPKGSVRYE